MIIDYNRVIQRTVQHRQQHPYHPPQRQRKEGVLKKRLVAANKLLRKPLLPLVADRSPKKPLLPLLAARLPWKPLPPVTDMSPKKPLPLVKDRSLHDELNNPFLKQTYNDIFELSVSAFVYKRVCQNIIMNKSPSKTLSRYSRYLTYCYLLVYHYAHYYYQ